MSETPDAEIARLRGEVARLEKMVEALVERSEAIDSRPTSDFAIFESTVVFEEQVRLRTRALSEALQQLEESNRALRKSQAKFQAIFDLMPVPVTLTTMPDGEVIDVSRSYAELCGRSREEILGRCCGPNDVEFWSDPGDRPRYFAALEAGGGKVAGFESRVRSPDGRRADVVLSGRIVVVEDQRLLLTEIQDVTDALRRAGDMQRIAETDPLTGLANRRLLMARLHVAVAQARRASSILAVAYLDLDGFKGVNDAFGHQAGDLVLIESARRLENAVRSGDTVGRLGGDEFAIVLPGMSSRRACTDVLRRAARSLSAPYHIDGGEKIRLSASVGVTLFPEDDSAPDALLEHADHAMYRAKRAGKKCIKYYRRE